MKFSHLPLAVCLFLSACAPLPNGKQKDTPAPQPPVPVPVSVSPVDKAAHDAGLNYLEGLAQAAKNASEAAEKFKSGEEMFESMSVENKAAREKSFQPYTDALDAASIPEDGSYDPSKTKSALSDAAKGFYRASQGK